MTWKVVSSAGAMLKRMDKYNKLRRSIAGNKQRVDDLLAALAVNPKNGDKPFEMHPVKKFSAQNLWSAKINKQFHDRLLYTVDEVNRLVTLVDIGEHNTIYESIGAGTGVNLTEGLVKVNPDVLKTCAEFVVSSLSGYVMAKLSAGIDALRVKNASDDEIEEAEFWFGAMRNEVRDVCAAHGVSPMDVDHTAPSFRRMVEVQPIDGYPDLRADSDLELVVFTRRVSGTRGVTLYRPRNDGSAYKRVEINSGVYDLVSDETVLIAARDGFRHGEFKRVINESLVILRHEMMHLTQHDHFGDKPGVFSGGGTSQSDDPEDQHEYINRAEELHPLIISAVGRFVDMYPAKYIINDMQRYSKSFINTDVFFQQLTDDKRRKAIKLFYQQLDAIVDRENRTIRPIWSAQ